MKLVDGGFIILRDQSWTQEKNINSLLVAREEADLNIFNVINIMIENDKALPQLLGQACSAEILESLVKSRLQLLDQMIFALDKSIHADDITNLQTEIVVLQGDDRLAAFTIVANQHNESWRNKNRNNDGYIEVDMVR